MTIRKHLVSVATVFALLGCSDRITDPVDTAPPSLAVIPDAGNGKHIVNFSGTSVPSDFADRVAALGGTVDAAYAGVGTAVVSGLTDAAVATLRASSGVSSIARDGLFQILDPISDQPFGLEQAGVGEVEIASPGAPATAAFFARQWHLRAIKADAAWAAGKFGSPSVRVAILDSGIGYEYADLQGLVDLSRSASFVPSDDALVARFFPGKHPVTDLHVHGTHVASIVSSNGLANAGVTSRTTLMGVKVVGVTGQGTTSGILAGIVYATDNGAHVINISLGSVITDVTREDLQDPAFIEFLRTTNKAIMYAVSRRVTVVVAAGNSALKLDGIGMGSIALYCDHPFVICVSATAPTAAASINGPFENVDAFAPYSNYGIRAVDVAAPGGTAAIPVWGACSRTSLVVPVCQTGTLSLGVFGTSSAAPHVSGLAALLVQKYGQNPLLIRLAIQLYADDIRTAPGSPGFDAFYGSGRINVQRSLGLR